jgi:hypothetical protein
MSSLTRIDWDFVGEYLMAGCSGVEVAAQLGIHENTLYQRCKSDLGIDFVAFKQEKQASGESLLRKVQFDAAIKDKDRAMLIWLGKQRLGQKEKGEQDIKVDGGINIVFKPANETS